MPRPKKNACRKFFEFDFEKKTNKCIVMEKEQICGKILNVGIQVGFFCAVFIFFIIIFICMKNDHGTNLACHIRTHHKQIWNQISKNKRIQEINSPTPNKTVNRSILNLFKVNIDMSKEILLKSCVELCTVNGRPFSLIEDSGFRKIIDPIAKGLGNFTINRKTVKDEALKKYKEITVRISKEMEGKLVSLKLDGLTHLNRAFLGKIFHLFLYLHHSSGEDIIIT